MKLIDIQYSVVYWRTVQDSGTELDEESLTGPSIRTPSPAQTEAPVLLFSRLPEWLRTDWHEWLRTDLEEWLKTNWEENTLAGEGQLIRTSLEEWLRT